MRSSNRRNNPPASGPPCQLFFFASSDSKGPNKNHQEFQVPNMEGFQITLFQAILGVGFPLSRIHTAYIGEDASILGP